MNTAEWHQYLMTLLYEGLRHVAFGIATSLLASVLHAVLVVFARRAVSSRASTSPCVEWYAPTFEGDSWTLGPHWPLLVLPPVGWVVALFLLMTEPFFPTGGVAVDIGVCGGESVTLRVVERKSNLLWSDLPADIRPDDANVRDETDPEVHAVNLRIDDHVEMEDLMVAVDRANALPGRTICLLTPSPTPRWTPRADGKH